MSINVGNYTFEGPYASSSYLNGQSGVYVILGNNGGNNWNVVDVGESSQLKTRVENHDRKMCWNGQKFANLHVAAIYANENSRMAIESQLRTQFNPPCGQR